MGEFQIDTGVAIPRIQTHPFKYPYPDMEVGDSIFVPMPAGYGPRTWRNAVSSTFIGHTKTYGGKFACRQWTTQDGVQGVRVWRTEAANPGAYDDR